MPEHTCYLQYRRPESLFRLTRVTNVTTGIHRITYIHPLHNSSLSSSDVMMRTPGNVVQTTSSSLVGNKKKCRTWANQNPRGSTNVKVEKVSAISQENLHMHRINRCPSPGRRMSIQLRRRLQEADPGNMFRSCGLVGSTVPTYPEEEMRRRMADT